MLSFIGRLLKSLIQDLQAESLRRCAGNPFPSWRTELFFTDESDRPVDHTNEVITETTEYGVVLPNGQVAWNAPDRPLGTPEQRFKMVQFLRAKADECGFDQEEFLANYNWVAHRVKTHTTNLGTFALTDPAVASAPVENGDDHERSDQDGSTGAHAADRVRGDLR